MVAQIEFAIAEKREVVVLHPREEGLGLGHLGGVDHGGARLEGRDGVVELAQHGPPIRDHRAYIGERLVEVRNQRLARLGRRLMVDADMHP